MINKNILQNKLVDKFHGVILNAIVSECFVSGLPIKSEYMDDTEATKLREYMGSVIESLGGFSMLEKAIESTTDFAKSTFLNSIYSVCHEGATTVANRIATETDCKKETDINKVVDGAAFTDAEYEKFVKNGGSINVEEVASIIQEKTKAALLSEKESYEKEEALEKELTDALTNTKDLAQESFDSYMNIILEKNAPRHYVSLFSKMQSYALESVNRLSDNTDYSYFDALDELTFESFLPSLRRKKNVIEALESVVSLQNATTDLENEMPKELRVKTATLISTVAYTAMESLKTMNLYNPSRDMIQKYVTSPYVTLESTLDTGAVEIIEKSQEAVDEVNRTDLTKHTVDELISIKDNLEKIHELLEIIVLNNEAFLNSRTEILNGLTNTLSKLNTYITSKQATDATESDTFLSKKNRESDTAQLNKINNLFSKNPLIDEIRLNVDPSTLSAVINVTGVDASGQVCNTSFIYIQAKLDNDKVIDYIKNIFAGSTLAQSTKKVAIYLSDGTAQKIQLK